MTDASHLGVPPLPLVRDAAAIMSFCVESLDDAVEDAAKLALLALAGGAASLLLRRASWSRRSTRAAAACVVVVLHPPVNVLADSLGDALTPVQRALRGAFMPGELPRAARPARRNQRGTATGAVIDDLVEDAFKLACVGSHALLGSALGTSLTQRALPRFAGTLIALGAPISEYQSCDEYGDLLGDMAQRWMEAETTG